MNAVQCPAMAKQPPDHRPRDLCGAMPRVCSGCVLIDEMSLITPNMLADIDRALKKATRCEHDFGNWLVILSGDFFQINDDVQYHNHTANDARCP